MSLVPPAGRRAAARRGDVIAEDRSAVGPRGRAGARRPAPAAAGRRAAGPRDHARCPVAGVVGPRREPRPDPGAAAAADVGACARRCPTCRTTSPSSPTSPRNVDKAAPDLLDALEDFTVTSRTVVEQRAAAARAARPASPSASDDLRRLPRRERREHHRARRVQPPHAGDASPGTRRSSRACSTSWPGLVPRLDEAFGAGSDHPGLHVTLEIVANQGKYVPDQDEPRYLDDRGPRCYPIQTARGRTSRRTGRSRTARSRTRTRRPTPSTATRRTSGPSRPPTPAPTWACPTRRASAGRDRAARAPAGHVARRPCRRGARCSSGRSTAAPR